MEDNVAFLCFDVARLFRRNFAEAAQEGGTGAQWRALMVLEKFPGINQAMLADRLDVEPITACRLVDRMEQAGLVERRRDPADRRVWHLHLSGGALKIVEELHCIGRDLLEQACVGLDADELKTLARLLGHMKSNLSTAVAQKEQVIHG